jgi:hypothetical protein
MAVYTLWILYRPNTCPYNLHIIMRRTWIILSRLRTINPRLPNSSKRMGSPECGSMEAADDAVCGDHGMELVNCMLLPNNILKTTLRRRSNSSNAAMEGSSRDPGIVSSAALPANYGLGFNFAQKCSMTITNGRFYCNEVQNVCPSHRNCHQLLCGWG